jgi:hypothetical protein
MPSSTTGVRRARLLALAGPAYAVLMVAAAAAFPAAPGGDVSPASDPSWLAAHAGAVIAQSYVRALAAVAFIVFAVAVAAVCRRSPGAPSLLPGLALAGGAVSGGLLLLGQAVALGSALAVDRSSTGTIRALGALQNGFLDMSSLPAVLLFGAAALAGLRTSVLPRWLAVVSLLGVPLAIADAASYDGGPLEALGLVGLAWFLLWSLVTGVLLAVRGAEARSAVVLGDLS